METLRERLVFGVCRADLGSKAVVSFLQLSVYVLDDQMDGDPKNGT